MSLDSYLLTVAGDLSKKQEEEVKKILKKSSKTHPFNRCFDKLDPVYLACQLTACDWDLIAQINPHDFFGRWMDRPSLCVVRDNYNMVIKLI